MEALIITLAFFALYALFGAIFGKKPQPQIVDDRREQFQFARAVLSSPQVDPDTGEPYAYEIKRVPVRLDGAPGAEPARGARR